MHVFKQPLIPEKDISGFGSLLSPPPLEAECEVMVKGKKEPKIEDFLHEGIGTVFKV